MSAEKPNWVRHVEGYTESGLTAKAYCEEHGINIGTFYHWSSKYKKEREKSKGGFVEVNSKESVDSDIVQNTPAIEISAGEITVRISENCDRQLLETVFQALEASVCS